MNRRTKLIWLSILIALLFGSIFLMRSRHPAEQQGTEVSHLTSSNEQFVANSPVIDATGDTSGPVKPAVWNPKGKLDNIVSAKNVPVHFWGKVIDGDDEPLAGVFVKSTVRHWKTGGIGAVGSDYHAHENTTEIDGRFEIKDDTGDALTITALTKPGFEPEPYALRTFGYNISENITPSVTNPVIFRLWKTTARQPLIANDKFLKIIPDGRVYTIDLMNGKMIESALADGDLRISVKRPMEAKLGDHYDWSCHVEMIAGGLVEEPDQLASMFIAPRNGYTNSFDILVDGNKSGKRMRRRFYVTTRGTLYGRIALDVISFFDVRANDGRCGIKSWVNPSGSRVLK